MIWLLPFPLFSAHSSSPSLCFSCWFSFHGTKSSVFHHQRLWICFLWPGILFPRSSHSCSLSLFRLQLKCRLFRELFLNILSKAVPTPHYLISTSSEHVAIFEIIWFSPLYVYYMFLSIRIEGSWGKYSVYDLHGYILSGWVLGRYSQYLLIDSWTILAAFLL